MRPVRPAQDNPGVGDVDLDVCAVRTDSIDVQLGFPDSSRRVVTVLITRHGRPLFPHARTEAGESTGDYMLDRAVRELARTVLMVRTPMPRRLPRRQLIRWP
jgi:hypothetical protein